jgi:hypothetical protein
MRKLGLVLVFLLASCGKLKELPTEPGSGNGGDPIDPTATFTRVQNEIFTPTCGAIGCHDPLGQQQQLILTPGRGYAVVGRTSTEMPQLKLVAPSDVPNSYLYRKITGAGITGDRMPQGGPYLTDAKIKLIRDWIRRGAPND